MKSHEKSIDLKRWMEDGFTFDDQDTDNFISIFRKIAKSKLFTIEKESETEKEYHLIAYYRPWWVRLVTLIPYGAYTKWGKALKLQTQIKKTTPIEMHLRIVPAMEFFKGEEEGFNPHSQDWVERVTDDAFAAGMFRSIIIQIHDNLNLEIPGEKQVFLSRNRWKDASISILLYPLEGYKSSRRFYHPPSDKKLHWSWKAFILPEIWFIWHEIWGIGILFLIPSYLWIIVLENPHSKIQLSVAIVTAVIHLIGGAVGGRAFYWRYGYWPGEGLGREKVTFKEWFKGSWKYIILVIAALITVQLILRVYQNAAPAILIVGAPFILLIFLILAAIIMHLPKKEIHHGSTNSNETVSLKSWLRSTAHLSIPVGLTLLVLGAVIINHGFAIVFFSFPFFIILFGIFYAIGLLFKKK